MTWFWPTVVALVALIGAWVWAIMARRASHVQAIEVLHWVERLLGGRGHVTGIRWVSASEFEIPVKLASGIFQQPTFIVQVPRAPTRGWLSLLSGTRAKTLMFRSDLDLKPRFAIQMQTMRYFARSDRSQLPNDGWEFEVSQPVVLTTRLDWQKEITGVIQSLLACADRENVDVKLQQSSPHFSASMSMTEIDLKQQPACAFFEVLCSVAESASAKAS